MYTNFIFFIKFQAFCYPKKELRFSPPPPSADISAQNAIFLDGSPQNPKQDLFNLLPSRVFRSISIYPAIQSFLRIHFRGFLRSGCMLDNVFDQSTQYWNNGKNFNSIIIYPQRVSHQSIYINLSTASEIIFY